MPAPVARKLRSNLTAAESRLWSRLRRKQIAGHRFRRQAPIGRYVADFVCHDARLIVEVDGGQHGMRIVEDAKRTAWLESQGYRVLRFWNNDVLRNTDGVIERIRSALVNAPLPSPPPRGGRGR